MVLRQSCVAALYLVPFWFAGFAQAGPQEGSIALNEGRTHSVKAGFEAGFQVVGEWNGFYRLNESFAPPGSYDPNPAWGEFYFKPYLTFEADLEAADLYGKVSLVASSSLGTDIFGQESVSAADLEDAVIGLRAGDPATGIAIDLSTGSQPYELASGMLLSDGGGDGFERGALIFGPRKAWEMSVLGRLSFGSTVVEAFYLDPRELESGDTGTTLAGAAVKHEFSIGRSVGVAAGSVIDSAAIWVQAAPGGAGPLSYIDSGRDGMHFIAVWGSWTFGEGFSLSADIAYEANDRHDMEAWGWRVQASYVLASMPYQPRVAYAFQSFSGDDPNTPELERFDPLFYNGSPSAWGSGANASLVFLNTNVAAHQISLAMTLSPSDYLTFRYFHVRANELLSPLQYGQGTRLDSSSSPTLIAGVTDKHLSDDIYAEYTHVLSASAFLTAGLTVSFPGAGIDALLGGDADAWPGAFVNLVLRY